MMEAVVQPWLEDIVFATLQPESIKHAAGVISCKHLATLADFGGGVCVLFIENLMQFDTFFKKYICKSVYIHKTP